ncbi:MAG TPA: hypothetical protein PK805_01060 [Acidovorax temperans]|jgi:hypothetical protein|nr:hypothetical protein [Acidovorax temperans]
MNHVDYLKRLGLQGGRLMWRVLMILGPVVGYSLWEAFKGMAQAHADTVENGPPEILSRWDAEDAFQKGQIDAAELIYYQEVYGD